MDRLSGPALESAIERLLAVKAAVAVVEHMPAIDSLTPGERETLQGFKAEPRRESWLLGRSALKIVMRGSNDGPDTTLVRFPHRAYSLAHTAGLAAAVRVREPAVLGVGIDIERPSRQPQMRAAHFFLTETERSWVDTQLEGRRPACLLRLWTVKEALYKANPENASTVLAEYQLDEPGAESARARIVMESSVFLFQYVTCTFEDAVVSVAVATGGSQCQKS